VYRSERGRGGHDRRGRSSRRGRGRGGGGWVLGSRLGVRASPWEKALSFSTAFLEDLGSTQEFPGSLGGGGGCGLGAGVWAWGLGAGRGRAGF